MDTAERLLHAAICRAVADMNIGETVRAHNTLRQILVDYADAHLSSIESKESAAPTLPEEPTREIIFTLQTMMHHSDCEWSIHEAWQELLSAARERSAQQLETRSRHIAAKATL